MLCATMIYKPVYRKFIVFCTVEIPHILYTYGLFHILLSFDTVMDPWNVRLKACLQPTMYIHLHKISIDGTIHLYVFYLVLYHDEPKHIAETNNKHGCS